jgi:iron complex outermembrane receptor protein
MHVLKRALLCSAVCVGGAGMAAPALAQSAELEEIIVTAQKRAESIQDVPISVSALSAEAIRDQGIGRIEDFATSLPSVYIDMRELRGTSISIRGIVSETNNPGVDQGVGVYVDGVYMGRPTTINNSLYDLERIEVLRGPQGTLYGKNTIAGAINFITRKPGDELRGDISASYGNYDAIRASASVSGPVVPGKFYVGVSGGIDRRDGLVKNLLTGTDLDDVDSLSGRLTAVYSENEDFELVVRVDASRDRTNSGAIDIVDNGDLTGTPLADASGWDRQVAQNRDTVQNRDTFGASGEINWSLGGGKLTSITAYREFQWYNLADNDYTALDLLASGISEDQNQFSQELRFASPDSGPLTYVFGVYYFHQRLETNSAAVIGADLGVYPEAVTGNILATIKSESIAGFGQAVYRVTDQFSITAGLRYTWEKKDVVHSQVGDPFGLLLATMPERRFGRSEDDFSPSLSLNYKWNDKVLTYATVSRGFKSGGYNVFSVTPTDDAEYEPEFVTSYEIGLKSDLLENRLRFNASAYYLRYKDLQVNQLELVGGLPQFQTSNAARARSKGVELELTARPVNGFDVTVNYSYLDAKFLDYAGATPGGDDFTGNTMVKAPKHNISVGAQYEAPLTDTLSLTLRGDLTHRSRIFFGPDNGYSQGDVTIVNGRIGIGSEQGWSLFLWGRNLTNKDYALYRDDGVIIGGQAVQSLSTPRTYGVEARFKF